MSSDTESAEPEAAQLPEEARPGWRVHDLPSADWALSRIAQAEHELSGVDEQEAAAIARIRQRAETLRAPLLRTRDFFTAHLRMWAEDNREDICRGGRKSRTFLHGRIGFRQTPLRLVVRDSSAFDAWAQQAGHGRMVWTPDMETVRNQFRAFGAIPPGCETDGGEERFVVTLEGAE